NVIRLRLHADHLLDQFAVFEQDHRRDAHHPEGLSDALVVVDVELAYLDLACELVCQLFDDGPHLTAGHAPRRPEVDEDQALGCFGCEAVVTELDQVIHFHSIRGGSRSLLIGTLQARVYRRPYPNVRSLGTFLMSHVRQSCAQQEYPSTRTGWQPLRRG